MYVKCKYCERAKRTRDVTWRDCLFNILPRFKRKM